MWYSSISFQSLALLWPAPGGRISCKIMYSKILYSPHSACASGLKAEGKCHRGSEASFSSVEDLRIENISSLHIPWSVAIVVPGSSIVYVLRSAPCLGVLVSFSPYNIFHGDGIWPHSVIPIACVVAHREIDKIGIVAPFVLLVSIHFCPCGICLGGLLSCLPWSRTLLLILSGSWVVAVIPGGGKVNSFFNRWVHGAVVRYAAVSPVEDGSVRWEGPSNIFALSSFVCPPVC